MLLKLECIDGYGIDGKNICEWVMIYLDWELWWYVYSVYALVLWELGSW
jgi:hypothetical protein